MQLGLIGCGSIGSTLARFLQVEPGVAEIIIWDRAHTRARELARTMDKVTYVPSFGAMLEEVEVVVEAASQGALRSRGPAVLEAGRELIVMSVGALAEPATLRALKRAARKGGSRFHVPSGAIAGLDGLKSAQVGNLRRVELETRKPPRMFEGTEAWEGGALARIRKPRTIFDGTAAEACRHFPQNVNVAATLGLAGLGAEGTRVRIVADPDAERNTHTITVAGDFGRMRVEVENLPSLRNPRTSHLAALSAVATVRGLLSEFKLGT